MRDLTIVTSCHGYGRFLVPWAQSIVKLTQYPAHVFIFTHGSAEDNSQGAAALDILRAAGLNAAHEHSPAKLDYGTARNKAVAASKTVWVMHLDCDDQIMPHALADIEALAPDADVISLGYERAGDVKHRPLNKTRLYRSGNGLEMLKHAAPCSGVSPFRRSLWERSPYRTDMRGAWDTALWIGFARLGARFRATRRPGFWYWHHADSVYTRRRLTLDWTHAITVAQLKMLRRDDKGVAFIVPRDRAPSAARQQAWAAVQAYYGQYFPDWPVCVGTSSYDLWCKGEAIDKALDHCSADVLIIMDADCIVPPEAIRWAVERVQAGAPWAVPHTMVYRANEMATQRFYVEQRYTLPGGHEMTRPPYMGYAGGGILVVRRVHYEAVGGIPFVFQGWGSEDTALATILDCMIGQHERGLADLIHLWHEPQATKRDSIGVARNHRKYRQVVQAAKQGRDALWQVLMSFPNGPLQPKASQVPWMRRVKPQPRAQAANANRNSYLARLAASRKPKPPDQAVG